MPKVKGEKVLLIEALSDISKELKSLSRDKKSIERKLDTMRKESIHTWDIEKQMKEKLEKLMNREAELTRKKNLMESKLANLKDKINRMKRAQQELSTA